MVSLFFCTGCIVVSFCPSDLASASLSFASVPHSLFETKDANLEKAPGLSCFVSSAFELDSVRMLSEGLLARGVISIISCCFW